MTVHTLLRGAHVLHPDDSLSSADVLLEDGLIASVGGGDSSEGESVDLSGLTLVPGFIDLHVHGGGGFSLITKDSEEVRSYARWAVSRGVTSFLGTVVGDDLRHALDFIRASAAVVGEIEGGANLLGVSVEGPFISPQRPGAMPPNWIAGPDKKVFDGLWGASAGSIKVMTVAPELRNVGPVMRLALEHDVVISVGHTDASFDQATVAFEAGARHVTHAFNAMRPLHHRDPGTLGAALQCPEATIEVIADGVHLHPATIDLLVRAFGPERVCLVTDAVSPAGMPAGSFEIGGRAAVLADGEIRLPDGTIAGSALTMDTAVRNVVAWGVAGLPAVARMASATPASTLRLSENKGSIAAGFDADLVALTPELKVAKTWVGGRLVYSA